MKRIGWVDTTRAIGMFLVFYGHYVERLSLIDGPEGIAMSQFAFIYSFHMPLFFIVAGFFAKKRSDKLKQLHDLFLKRILPVLSFAVLFVPLWLLYFQYLEGSPHVERIGERSLEYLGGNPQLNFTTWFLICLFVAEAYAVLLGAIRESRWINLGLGVVLIGIGYLVTEQFALVSAYARLDLNFWYVHEGIVALGFYLLGKGLFPILEQLNQAKWRSLLVASLSLTGLLSSRVLLDHEGAVLMVTSVHGDFFPFVLEAILGSLFIISLAMMIPSNQVTRFIGQNSLIFLGLNGAFLHFLNPFFANWFFIADPWWSVTLSCTLVTIGSMAICVPAILLMNRFVPQLFGKPFVKGPLLNGWRK